MNPIRYFSAFLKKGIWMLDRAVRPKPSDGANPSYVGWVTESKCKGLNPNEFGSEKYWPTLYCWRLHALRAVPLLRQPPVHERSRFSSHSVNRRKRKSKRTVQHFCNWIEDDIDCCSPIENIMECLAAHSGLMPANLTTLAHFWVSSAMSVPKAREHALGAYKICWGDGAPFHHHWPLEMPAGPTAVGEPEPQLPSVDPPTVKPFDFEADVERLIEKTLAERSEREEKAKPESKARPRRKKY